MLKMSNIFQTVKECINDYNLIVPKDKVLLGLSGGKDSMTCLSVLNGLKEELDFLLGCVFVSYPMEDLPKDIKDYVNSLNIPLYFWNVKDEEYFKKNKNLNCNTCAHLRRMGLLKCGEKYNYNKIAVAHNYEDNCETVLLNLFTGKGLEKLEPKRVYFEKYTLIRPMLYVREKKIISFTERNFIPVCNNKCENLPNCGRIKIREILKDLSQKYINIYDNIMYAELNTKSDYCQCCGYDGEILIVENEDGKLIWRCPHCGNEDQDKMNVARRTCGYIGTQFWNQGRTQEIKERVLHL